MISEIPYENPVNLYSRLYGRVDAALLESTCLNNHQANYSFIGVDPFVKLTSKNQRAWLNDAAITGNPWQALADQLEKFHHLFAGDLLPFQGGAIGFLGYELAQHLENIPLAQDDMQFPDMALNFYDLVIGFNHSQTKAYVFSSGLPETSAKPREQRAKKRLAWLLEQLKNPVASSKPSTTKLKIKADLTREQYIRSVNKIIDYIYAGDIFEANFTQRFSATLPADFCLWQLYLQLRGINPAPFSAFIPAGDTSLIASSPERFLKLSNRQAETQPIKGTCRRGKDLVEDKQLKQALLNSEKDRAENIMIVDLMRNDLAKVCKPDSVIVNNLCAVETFTHVHHLVSMITGELVDNYNAVDLLKACFPGGSITGAPKVRAMEIIAELEPTQRGPYCGCFGYLDFNGNMDMAMTIRSFAAKSNILTWQAGGAIVADSDSAAEYEESLIKADALTRALAIPDY